jgi:protein involved in polysaccharide export with SLBB domain
MDAAARPTRRLLLVAGLALGAFSAANAATRAPAFADIPYADWSDAEPPYRLYPGDEVEVTVLSAPELTKTVTVQPDGRIALPLISPVMVTDRTIDEVQRAVAQAYSSQLLRPDVNVSPKAAPLKVFVGGEVGNPGVYDMVGDSDALRAIVQAGGFKPSADAAQVIILRRGYDGRGMVRQINLARGLGTGAADLAPLRRFDVVFVPRSGIAKINLAVQQYIRDLSPMSLGFSYAIGDNNN